MQLTTGVKIVDLDKYRQSLQKRIEARIMPDKYAYLNYLAKEKELHILTALCTTNS